MFFDAEELRDEDGLDLNELAAAIELAMVPNIGTSKEAQWLGRHLEYMRDECERPMIKVKRS